MIFDSHAHYDDDAFNDDRDSLLSSMQEGGVGNIVLCASSWDSLQKISDICNKYSFCHAAYGIHPENGAELTYVRREQLEAFIESHKPVAIGEIGLDYYWDEPSRDIQRTIFEYQLGLARKFNLPVIIHAREASEETFEFIKKYGPDRKGVIHCFSGSLEMAENYVKMGYYIGIGGVVTFKNGRKLKEIAASVPLSSILIETDCPYLAPVPFRGERNSSLLLPYVVKEIAELRGISEAEVYNATEENAKQLFNIK